MKRPTGEVRPRLALAAVIVAYIALSVASSFVTRLRYGPDEPAHFIYVREIATRMRMPTLAHQVVPHISTPVGREVRNSHEAHQPPLYHILSSVPYFVARSFGAATDTIWRVLRMFTALLGAGWVYFLYRLSREFFRESRYQAIVAAAFIGLLPSAVYIGGVVNNDALSALLFTAALWVVVRCVRRDEIDRKAAFQAGILAGLAVLTKAQGLFLLPTIAAAALVIARRRGWARSLPTFGNAGIAILAAILVSSVWFVRNWYVHGSFVIQSLESPGPGWSPVAVALVTDQLFKFFWTPFWLIRGFIDDSTYARLLLALCLVIGAAAVGHFRACWKTRTDGLACRLDAWMLLVLPAVLIYVFLVRHTLVVDMGALQQGRLLLPAAPILGIAVVAGPGSYVRRSVARSALGFLLIVGLIAADLAVLRAIAAFYQMG